jgi:peptidyl-prolyl cis-trans isomerase B (cyclophilin B)
MKEELPRGNVSIGNNKESIDSSGGNMRSFLVATRSRGAVLALTVGSLFLLLPLLTPIAAEAGNDPVLARCDTDSGSILIVLYPELAPKHVDNFSHLARSGFYNGTKFHRVIPDFMIQGGDPNSKDMDPRNDGMGGPMLADVLDDKGRKALEKSLESVNKELTRQGYKGLDGFPLVAANLKAEFSESVNHLRGTLSMARGGHDIDSAGSQFFICVSDKTHLDGQYSIFGFTVMGMDVADRIVNGPKRPGAGPGAARTPVEIKSMTIIEGTGGLTAEEITAWEALPAERKNVN